MAQILDRCVIHISGKKRLSDRSNLKLLIVLSLSFRFPIQEGADLQDLSSSPGSRLLGWKLFKVRPDFRLIATLHSQQSGAMAGLIACPHMDKSGTEPGTGGPETWPMTIWDGPGERWGVCSEPLIFMRLCGIWPGISGHWTQQDGTQQSWPRRFLAKC